MTFARILRLSPHVLPKGERRALGYSEFASLAKRVHTTSGIYAIMPGFFFRDFPATDANGFSEILSYWQKILELWGKFRKFVYNS